MAKILSGGGSKVASVIYDPFFIMTVSFVKLLTLKAKVVRSESGWRYCSRKKRSFSVMVDANCRRWWSECSSSGVRPSIRVALLPGAIT